MDITLIPEMEALIRQHLAHGCSQTPESVLTKALQALGELEAKQSQAPHPPKPLKQNPLALPISPHRFRLCCSGYMRLLAHALD